MFDVDRLKTANESCEVCIMDVVLGKIDKQNKELSYLFKGDVWFEPTRDKSCGLQVYACNHIFKQWLYKIMAHKEVTAMSLILMLNNDDYQSWLENVEKYVIPYLVKNIKVEL